uniref:Uncharacterized protein n=1 Tax=viral metagenome TaxID=1070528 RepID=A0A6H1ZN95_9ZZZZ
MYRKLLIPGWAGELGDDEVKFIREKLKKSPGLKGRWGIKRVSEKEIRRVALEGVD